LSNIKVLGVVRVLRKINVTAVLSATHEMAKARSAKPSSVEGTVNNDTIKGPHCDFSCGWSWDKVHASDEGKPRIFDCRGRTNTDCKPIGAESSDQIA